jgi:hypothetical protein
MKLNREQTKTLLQMVATSKPDEIDCDGCFEHLAEFVEHELLGTEIPKALEKVKQHIEQCACCNDEHNALVEALEQI